MADYTEESVLITPDATFKGLGEIRKNFEDAYRIFPKDKTVFQLSKRVIDRDVAYILWQAKTPTFNLTYATDTFIIRNGKSLDRRMQELLMLSKVTPFSSMSLNLAMVLCHIC
jgi:hypothetical protein